MLVQDFFVNSVYVAGTLVNFADCGDGTGHVLLRTGEESTVWIYCDYAPTWEQAQGIEVGTSLQVHAAIKPSEGEGGNDILTVRNISTAMPPVSLAGMVANPKVKQTSKGAVMTFAISMTEKSGGEKVNRFYNCELWNEYLHKKIAKGTFVSVTGSLRMDYYTDKAGTQRSSCTVVVHNVATPPPSMRNSIAPSAPVAIKNTPAIPTGAKATTPVAPAVPDTDGVVF